MAIVRFHYLYLVPLILLMTPSQAILGLNVPAIIVLVIVGLAGNVLGKIRLSILTSISLLCLLVWGKVVQDLLGTERPDTAIFLIMFGMTVFLMEASIVVASFRRVRGELGGKDDEPSYPRNARLNTWLRNQLSIQGMTAVGCLGLSLVLLPVAGFTSISTAELPLTGGLLLVAIIALLFLATYRREPNRR